MILVTCTIASFETQRGAESIARAENAGIEDDEQTSDERILIPVSNPETVDELIHLSTMIKSKKNKSGLVCIKNY
jgi:hypothetical protein